MTTPPPKQHIAQTLLSRAHSPQTTETLFTDRIKQKPLYLRPTSPSASDNRSRRRHHRLRKKEYFLRHQRPKPLSAKEKRASGIHELADGEAKYEIFKGLHALWVRYMQEVLDLRSDGSTGQGGGMVTALSHGSKLVSADFHGAEIEVVRSGCAGRVGIRGVVVRDTKFTFVVVTERDEVKSAFSLHCGVVGGHANGCSNSQGTDDYSLSRAVTEARDKCRCRRGYGDEGG